MSSFYSDYIHNPTLSRSEALARYIIDTGDTVRGAAKIFGISKSTVHKDITKVLPKENLSLYAEVSKVLQINKQERHIRGGIATRDKYLTLKQQKQGSCDKLKTF